LPARRIGRASAANSPSAAPRERQEDQPDEAGEDAGDRPMAAPTTAIALAPARLAPRPPP
jgi:hypothetical protein